MEQHRASSSELHDIMMHQSVIQSGRNPLSFSPPKKRHTTSPPPEEVGASIPPRLLVDNGSLNYDCGNGDDELDKALQTKLLFTPPSSPTMNIKESKLGDMLVDVMDCTVDEEAGKISDVDFDISMADVESSEASEYLADRLPPRPLATFTTLPPELSLYLLSFMPINSHTKLYETNRHYQNLIKDNDDYLYTKAIAKAGSNPRGESLLARSIFAFQYSDKPRRRIDPVVDLNTDETTDEIIPKTNIQYLRFLSTQFEVIRSITDELQSEFYHTYLTSEAGLKELRLTAHGSHNAEDLLLADNVDRDLMHLWEFINFSHEQLVNNHAQRRYPLNRQKKIFVPEYPVSSTKLAKETTEVRRSPRGHKKSTEYPHNSFLVWERKRLRDFRNEYWREDTENLSKVESRDLRWILEVIKAAVVGKAISFLVEEEKQLGIKIVATQTTTPTTIPGQPVDSSSQTVPVDLPDLPSPPTDTPGLAIPTRPCTPIASLFSLPPTPPQTPPNKLQEPLPPISQPTSPKFSHTDVRAYAAYLIATGGPKLINSILKRSHELGRSLTSDEFENVLKAWDNKRSVVDTGLYVEVDDDEDKPSMVRERRKIERLWERDCRRGGWRNWEGWVGEYYVIG